MLAAAYAGRLAINRAGVRADAADPGRAFGFFTLAAGSNVLAARLAADDHLAAAAVGLTSLPPPWPGGLVAVAVACWAVGVIGCTCRGW